jgi:uncharacterized OsmC-like protein
MSASTSAGHFAIRVEQVDGFEFRVKLDKQQYAELQLDEPAPLGRDSAPNAVRLLAAAVGNCLAASLVFCAKKSGTTLGGVSADVDVELVRNEHRRLRVGKVDVTLRTSLPPEHPALQACLTSFEDFCVVTQSVRQGIDVAVRVL